MEISKFGFILNKQEIDTLLSQLQFTINNMVWNMHNNTNSTDIRQFLKQWLKYCTKTSESFLRKSLAQGTCARKLAQVTCKSSTWLTCKLNNESCRLKVAFHGRYCVVTDWPITAHHLRKKTFRNRTHSISDSWLSQVRTCASVYTTSESFFSKVALESDFWKKTFRYVIGFSLSKS